MSHELVCFKVRYMRIWNTPAVYRPVKLKVAAIATPSDWAASEKARDLSNAQADLRDALDAFEAARLAIATSNRLFRKKRHDREITPDFVADRRRRDAFVAINRARGKIVRARKALAKLADA